MKRKEIYDLYLGLSSIKTIELNDINVSYKIATVLLKIHAYASAIENERNKLVKKFGCKNENGQFSINFGTEEHDNFEKELNNFLDIEESSFTLSENDKITIAELQKALGNKSTPELMGNLFLMIKQ